MLATCTTLVRMEVQYLFQDIRDQEMIENTNLFAVVIDLSEFEVVYSNGVMRMSSMYSCRNPFSLKSSCTHLVENLW
jgi:hypothetical protein